MSEGENVKEAFSKDAALHPTDTLSHYDSQEIC